jgi:deoxyribonuclease V
VRPVVSHRWDLREEEASTLQRELASLVITEDQLPAEIRTVAGVDVAYMEHGTSAFSAVAVLDVASGRVNQVVSAEANFRFPYVPGLLSFRELPVLAAAFDKLSERPDLVICDGQGIAHPRRFGLACHIGVAYDVPAIGCAKTWLTGEAGGELGFSRGSSVPLVRNGETVGAVLRTQDGVKPVYVSPGHRVSLGTSCNWTLALCRQYRLPEPIRAADQTVGRMKRQAG